MLVNMLEGRFVSAHDVEIASRASPTRFVRRCHRTRAQGGRDRLLALERRHFVALAQMPKTQERIQHTLTTGKPLPN